MIKKNREKPLAVIDLEHLFELALKRTNDPNQLTHQSNQQTLSHSYTNLLHPWSVWSVVSALFDSVMCYICVVAVQNA